MLFRNSLLLLLAGCTFAASNELQPIADQARSLPPEFAADVLLKIIASPLAKDLQWKRNVIEDAFLAATHAERPYRKQGPRPQFDLRLDTLTLQIRAVDAMAAIDPARALALFRAIALPPLSKVSCQDAATPDVSNYYQLAASLFVTAFSHEQRTQEVDIAFLRERIGAIASPSQVVPALKMLAQVGLRDSIRSELMVAFSAALDRIHGGSREFSASEPLLVSAAVPEMHELGFLPSLRAYIVRHASGPRCSDTVRAGQLTESAAQFNKLLIRVDPQSMRFHPIAVEESTPLRDDGTYSIPGKTQSDHTVKVSELLATLHQAQPSTPAWTDAYGAAMSLLENWKPGEEDSLDEYSLRITNNFAALLEAIPAGPVHRVALTRALRFVEQQFDAGQRTWLVELRALFDHADQEWLSDQLMHSRSPGISVYGQLKRLLSAA